MTDYKTQAEQLVDEFYQLLSESLIHYILKDDISDLVLITSKECALLSIDKSIQECEWGGCNSGQVEELKGVKNEILSL